MLQTKRLLYTSGLLIFLVVAASWGFQVHRTVNQLAIYALPDELRCFYFDNKEYMIYNAPRPDIRRNTDSTEAPKHFIDLEMYGDPATTKMPYSWDEAVKRYTKDTLLKYGYVPYVIMKMKDSLVDAFRSMNKEKILFYSADLGHYMGDAHVPLHNTVNYDGQLTNQRGLHNLWETTVPELEIATYDLRLRHNAQYLLHPEEQLWKDMRHAYDLLPQLFALEKEVSKQFTDETKYVVQVRRGREVKSYSSAFARAYGARLAPGINQQLVSSARLLSDFIYTAWVDAGKPDLEKLLTPDFKNKKKKALKQDMKNYRNNTLKIPES